MRKKVLEPLKIEKKESPDVILGFHPTSNHQKTERIIVIGASTGGVQAVENLIKDLPISTPGILIVQHMPVGFTKSFANRLDNVSNISVKEVEDGDRIIRGRALVAIGDVHLLVKRVGTGYVAKLVPGPKVSRHRPAVDILFRSAANEAGKNAIGVILTGMGDDGAIGMTELKQNGARTYAQNQESCVVYGMPKEAVKRGVIDEILPLEEIADRLQGR